MWRWLPVVALLCGLFMPGAQGESLDREGWRVLAQRSQDRDAQRGGYRRDDQRERRERRREADRQERQQLTPDERRELNRDLRRANREIYRQGRDRR